MKLKVGELARRTGLTVRTLHHYDAIGLLCPGERSLGGARLYGRDDLIRLHRIEALKQLACSLPDIQVALAKEEGEMPVELLQRQIDSLNAMALQSQRLSGHLQTLLNKVAAGGEAAADDWLNTLELMHLYQKHLNTADIHALLQSGGPQQLDTLWLTLAAEVRDAIAQPLAQDSPAAHALAWRWMRQALQMSGHDIALAVKLMAMQTSEPRAQDIVGITPAMFDWIAVVYVHARCALFAPHLTAEQLAEVRRRQLDGLPLMQAWPALMSELRAQMRAGTDARDPVVQGLARRWQQLFRDSYCGEDAALEVRVRHALMLEADLRLGVEDDLLAYLQRAHVAGHSVPTEFAGPKPSALLVALQRAAHQLLETPLVLDDPLALAVLGETEQSALRADLARYAEPFTKGLRSSVVVRSRLAEDEWTHAIARGVRQYVVLGAGLDTSALRHPEAPGARFEVDLPSTQAWKRQRLQEAGISVPPQLRWVPVDFETVHLAEGLASAGFDARQPAYFSWLGVSMYLEPAAVIDTLRFVAGCAKGSAILFEYVVPLDQLPAMMRVAMQQVIGQLAARGEPWKTHLDTDELVRDLQALGFDGYHLFNPETLNQRYLDKRSDGLHLGVGPGRLMLATV